MAQHEEEPTSGGYEYESDSRQETEENPNRLWVGDKHHGDATGALPLARLPSRI
jgi:hypothetical protein